MVFPGMGILITYDIITIYNDLHVCMARDVSTLCVSNTGIIIEFIPHIKPTIMILSYWNFIHSY